MIGRISRVNGDKLDTYYEAENYYFRDQKHPAVHGDGVELFGVKKAFTKKQFNELLSHKIEGRNGGKPLKGVDMGFAVPKSVSITYALGTDEVREAIKSAFKSTSAETMNYIQESGQFRTRIKSNGKVQNVRANGMVALEFLHDTSRNLDMQLHSHRVIGNICVTPDGKIRSVDYGVMHRNIRQNGTIERAALLNRLREQGIQTEVADAEKGFFEIKGYSKESLSVFSSRRGDMEKYAEERGIELTPKRASMVAKATRDPKQTDLDKAALVGAWRDKARGHGIDAQAVHLGQDVGEAASNRELLARAIQKLEDSKGVFTTHDINYEIARESITANQGITYKQSLQAIQDHGHEFGLVRIPGQGVTDIVFEKYTTENMLDVERGIVNSLDQGKGNARYRVDVEGIDANLASYQDAHERAHGWRLGHDQTEAAREILGGKDNIIGVQGLPGTGKTSMLKVVREIGGDKIHGLALQAVAARNLQHESGIASQTIAKFLHQAQGNTRAAQGLRSKLAGGLIVIDEAGMIGSKQLGQVLGIAGQVGAKVALVGDKDQLVPVEAGKPFQMLQDRGMRTVALTDIRRQQDATQLAAVHDIVTRRDVGAAIDRLADADKIKVDPVKRHRHRAIAEEYLQDRKMGIDPLVITSQNAAKDNLNREIRFRLVRNGIIDHSKSNNLSVETRNGKEKKLDFAPQDKIAFEKNDKNIGVNNGDIGKIIDVSHTKMTVQLQNGNFVRFDPRQYKHFDHGYAATSYKSQGQTHQKSIVDADSKSKLLTMNEFGVDVTRQKKEISIYTDDIDELRKKATRKQNKLSALEEYEKGTGKDEKPVQATKTELKKAEENNQKHESTMRM